jgi:hydrogenase nickel incorporation protein HypA/HybF
MHELSLSGAIVEAALRHAGGARVKVVSVRVGALRQAVPEALDFAFQIVAQGTRCEGAELVQTIVAARLTCTKCGATSGVGEPPLWCRTCGGRSVAVTAGAELELESIVVEDGACTASS